MWWILVWVLLVVASAAVVGLLGWRLFRQVLAFGSELGASGGRVAEAMSPRGEPAPVTTSVFVDELLDLTDSLAVQRPSRGSVGGRA